jgi:hypothetical protein
VFWTTLFANVSVCLRKSYYLIFPTNTANTLQEFFWLFLRTASSFLADWTSNTLVVTTDWQHGYCSASVKLVCSSKAPSVSPMVSLSKMHLLTPPCLVPYMSLFQPNVHFSLNLLCGKSELSGKSKSLAAWTKIYKPNFQSKNDFLLIKPVYEFYITSFCLAAVQQQTCFSCPQSGHRGDSLCALWLRRTWDACRMTICTRIAPSVLNLGTALDIWARSWC